MSDPGAWFMPFGKHKGKSLVDVPTPYLRWLLDNAKDLRADTREIIEAFIGTPGARTANATTSEPATCARCGHPGSDARPLMHRDCSEEDSDIPF